MKYPFVLNFACQYHGGIHQAVFETREAAEAVLTQFVERQDTRSSKSSRSVPATSVLPRLQTEGKMLRFTDGLGNVHALDWRDYVSASILHVPSFLDHRFEEDRLAKLADAQTRRALEADEAAYRASLTPGQS